MKKRLDIVIPAAGLGRRMKSYGPKSIIPIAGEPLIARQIRLLKGAYPTAMVVVVVGFEADKVRKALPRGVRVFSNDDFENTNVAKSVELGLNHLDVQRPALVVYGDLVFNHEAVAALDISKSWVLVDPDPERVRDEEVGVNICDGKVVHFCYGLPKKWGHVVLLAPKEKALFIHAARVDYRKRYYGYEILNEVIDMGGVFHAYTPNGMRLVEVDTSKDILRAEKAIDKV